MFMRLPGVVLHLTEILAAVGSVLMEAFQVVLKAAVAATTLVQFQARHQQPRRQVSKRPAVAYPHRRGCPGCMARLFRRHRLV
ncbi:hypothetical protein A5686_01755 [Mycobacterium sp. E2479]|nr:hypothetical protein A5686_01755 [Mycobacterium sp. E2479]